MVSAASSRASSRASSPPTHALGSSPTSASASGYIGERRNRPSLPSLRRSSSAGSAVSSSGGGGSGGSIKLLTLQTRGNPTLTLSLGSPHWSLTLTYAALLQYCAMALCLRSLMLAGLPGALWQHPMALVVLLACGATIEARARAEHLGLRKTSLMWCALLVLLAAWAWGMVVVRTTTTQRQSSSLRAMGKAECEARMQALPSRSEDHDDVDAFGAVLSPDNPACSSRTIAADPLHEDKEDLEKDCLGIPDDPGMLAENLNQDVRGIQLSIRDTEGLCSSEWVHQASSSRNDDLATDQAARSAHEKEKLIHAAASITVDLCDTVGKVADKAVSEIRIAIPGAAAADEEGEAAAAASSSKSIILTC